MGLVTLAIDVSSCVYSLYVPQTAYPGHPPAQKPDILGLLGFKHLEKQRAETLRPHFGGPLDVEGSVVIGTNSSTGGPCTSSHD